MKWISWARADTALLLALCCAASARAELLSENPLPPLLTLPARAPARATTWHVNEGALLSATLREWALVSGWTVVWRLPENEDVRMPTDSRYQADFQRAVIDLFDSLPAQAHVRAELRDDASPPLLFVSRDSRDNAAGRVRRLVASALPPLAVASTPAAESATPAAAAPTPLATASTSQAATAVTPAPGPTMSTASLAAPVPPAAPAAGTTRAPVAAPAPAAAPTPTATPVAAAAPASSASAASSPILAATPTPTAAPAAPPAPVAAQSLVLHKGKPVAEELRVYGLRTGWDLVWDAPTYVAERDMVVPGTFEVALESFLKGANEAGTRIRAVFYRGNNTVRISEF